MLNINFVGTCTGTIPYRYGSFWLFSNIYVTLLITRLRIILWSRIRIRIKFKRCRLSKEPWGGSPWSLVGSQWSREGSVGQCFQILVTGTGWHHSKKSVPHQSENSDPCPRHSGKPDPQHGIKLKSPDPHHSGKPGAESDPHKSDTDPQHCSH